MFGISYDDCVAMLADYEGGAKNKELQSLVAKKDKRLIKPMILYVEKYLKKEINFSRSEKLAEAACIALGAIGDPSPLEKLVENIEIAVVQKKLWGPHFDSVLHYALEAAAGLHDASPSPRMEARFRRLEALGGKAGKFGSDRLLVLRSVADGSYKRLRPALLALNGKSGEAEFSAGLALLQGDGSPCAIEFLINRAAFEWSYFDPSERKERIYDAAVGAGARAVPPLIRILELDESVSADRSGAGDALRRIGKSAVPALIGALKDKGSIEAYGNLRILKEKGELSGEDMKALLAMNGRTLEEHTDKSPSCGHTDIGAVVVSF
jgi:hypothetical protein